MLKSLMIFFSLLICACSLQAQVWTKLVDSTGTFQITTLVKDSVNNTLYMGGVVTAANTLSCGGIIKYNGSTFDTLQSGVETWGVVKSLQMFQNKLYAFGSFYKTGVYNCKYMGRWNGISWDTLNFKPDQPIWWSDVYNNELYVSGWFDTIAGQPIKHVAKFDGTNWHGLSFPNADMVGAIKNYKGTLYAASYTGLWQYKNNNWTHLADCGGDMFRHVYGMEVIDNLLYIYGRFNSLGGVTSKGIVAFDGVKWYGLGQGMSYSGYEIINNVQKIDGNIYITGNFENVEGIGNSTPNQNTNYAVLSNNQWCIKSPPFDNASFGVVKYNGDLHIYGAFSKCGTDTVFGFAKWVGGNTIVSCSNTFTISNTYVGINEISISDNIKVYPNPATDILNIEDQQKELQNSEIEIRNTLGQVVLTTIFSNQIDISNLKNGVYFLSVKNKNYKIIKQ